MKINKEKLILVSLFVLVPTLIYLRDVTGININKYFFLLIISVASLFLSVKSNVVLLSFLIPFFSGIPSNYIFIVLMISIITKVNTKVPSSMYLCIIGILCIELLNNINFEFKFFEFIMYSIYLFSIITLLSLKKENISNVMNVYSFSVGLVFCNIIIYFNTMTVIDFNTLINSAYRYGNVLDLKPTSSMILTHDQNFIGYMSILSISSLILSMSNYKENKKMSKLLAIILISFNLFFAVLAASRAFILCLIVFILWSLIKSIFIKRSIKSFIIMLLAIGTLYVIIFNFFPEVFKNIIDRFNEEDITGGRIDINNYYIQFIEMNPRYLLFGTSILSMLEVAHYPSTIHNATLQIIVAYGLVGSLFFIALIFVILKREIFKFNYKFTNLNIDNFVPLILGVLMIQTIPFISPYYFMLPLIISIFAMRIKNDNLKKRADF